jgi:hypothetical protein
MKNNKLNEGLESLNRIKLLMSYKNDMTLTENEIKIKLNEQTSDNCVVSIDEMQEYVDSAVEMLNAVINYDLSKLFSTKEPAFGFGVGEQQLSELLELVTNLSNCTFEDKNALIAFLKFYKEEEGDDFREEIRNIGVKTLGKVKAPRLKQSIISVIDKTKTSSTQQTTTNNPLDSFKIYIKNDWGTDFKGNETFGIEGDLYYVMDDKKERYNYKLEGNKFIFVQ